MSKSQTFDRRGIVEGFFGPLWSTDHRKRLFEFGAARGMNTYLYAPKDDPYHRERWTEPYPPGEWKTLQQLIRYAQQRSLDFVYGFHPGKGLCFSDEKPLSLLLGKAQRFYDAGVRIFAVLFDDIPSQLDHEIDRKNFNRSLARAQGTWLDSIMSRQPSSWNDVEWWICPSYYTPDPLLARVFGAFEPRFLKKLSETLPAEVACFWTGPSVVAETITLRHVRAIARRLNRRLLLWDNYPVNDLSMRDELHIGPLQGRDGRLPQSVYGYLSNPLLQEELGFIPLACCFDYAAHPASYNPEASWTKIIGELFGARSVSNWRAIRNFCAAHQRAKKTKRPLHLSANERPSLKVAAAYLRAHEKEKWAREIRPWRALIEKALR